MRDLALTLFVFTLLPFVILRPHWGILLWTWIGLMNPHQMTFGFSRAIPFAMIVALVTIVAIAISPEKKRLPINGIVVTLILFAAWMTVSTTMSLFPDLAWPYWELVMKIQFVGILTMLVMQSKERITALVWVSTLSLAFFGIKGGIATIVRAGDVIITGSGGFLGGNNQIAVAFTMTLPLMYWLYLQVKQRWIRIGIVAGMVLTVVATFGTGSRGGFVAIAAMGVWLWFKSRHKLAMALLLALFIPMSFSVMPEQWHARMETIRTYDQDTSALARFNAWEFAVNLARDRPFVGGGFQAFQPEAFEIWGPDATQRGLRADEWHDAHSIWFKVLGEHGYPGLALYLILWFLTWRLAKRIIVGTRRRPDQRWAHDLAAVIQVSLIGFWVGGSFLSFAYWDYPLVLIAILVTTRAVLDREVAAAGVRAGAAAPPEPVLPRRSASMAKAPALRDERLPP